MWGIFLIIAASVLVGYLNKRAQVVIQSFLVTSGDYMYNHTKKCKAGKTYNLSILNSISKMKPHFAQRTNWPQGVDSNLVGFFGGRCEHLEQLHQHCWQEVDDDMSLHGM